MLPSLIDQTAREINSRYELYTLALRGGFARALEHAQPHSSQARSAFSEGAQNAFHELFPGMAESIATAVDALALQAIADAGADTATVESLELGEALEGVKEDLYHLINFIAKADARRALVKLRGMGLDRRLNDAVRAHRSPLEFKTPDTVGRLVDSARYVVQDVRHALVKVYVETCLIAARSLGAQHFELHKDGQVIGTFQIAGDGEGSYVAMREKVFHPNTRAYPVISRSSQ